MTVDNGLITGHRFYFDVMDFLNQLGLEQWCFDRVVPGQVGAERVRGLGSAPSIPRGRDRRRAGDGRFLRHAGRNDLGLWQKCCWRARDNGSAGRPVTTVVPTRRRRRRVAHNWRDRSVLPTVLACSRPGRAAACNRPGTAAGAFSSGPLSCSGACGVIPRDPGVRRRAFCTTAEAGGDGSSR